MQDISVKDLMSNCFPSRAACKHLQGRPGCQDGTQKGKAAYQFSSWVVRAFQRKISLTTKLKILLLLNDFFYPSVYWTTEATRNTQEVLVPISLENTLTTAFKYEYFTDGNGQHKTFTTTVLKTAPDFSRLWQVPPHQGRCPPNPRFAQVLLWNCKF